MGIFYIEKEMPEGYKPMSDRKEWIAIDCSQFLPLQEQKDIKQSSQKPNSK